MAVSYYQPDIHYPLILKPAIETYLEYIKKVLYTEDSNCNDKPIRIIRANIGDSDDVARNAADISKITNYPIPFTAFNVGEPERDDRRQNYYGASGNVYVPDLDCYITTIPYRVKLPLISFFATAFDYNRAMTKLRYDLATVTRLFFLVNINGRISKHSINIILEEPAKGKYAFEFAEQLRVGDISDIVHSVTIEFNEIIVNTVKHEPIQVHPVDEIVLNFFDLEAGTFIYPEFSALIPSVISTSPVNKKDSVAVDSAIEILFNTPLNTQQDFIDLISINPVIPFEVVLDATQKLLTITPTEDLDKNTIYEVNVTQNIFSDKGVYMNSDYTFSFKTVRK